MGKWTSEEEERLRELYPTKDNRDIAAKLGRSVNSIAMKAYKMGLQKKEEEKRREGGSASAPTPDSIIKLTREEAQQRDGVDVLTVCWGLVEQLREELRDPALGTKDRLKVMGSLSNAVAVLSKVMERMGIGVPEKESDIGKMAEEFSMKTGIPVPKLKKLVRKYAPIIRARFREKKKNS